MKKNLLFIFLALVFISCSKEKEIEIQVNNDAGFDRTEEIVEIAWSTIDTLTTSSVIVLDENGIEIPSQIIYHGKASPQSLIFAVTIPANSQKTYTIKEGIPGSYPLKTFGRAIPERKDDFAWENDRVVYRIYGPALANENPSNGYDMWLKKTDKMIIDQFYKDDLENGKSYHVDHGEGLDCYKVGHTLGAGAIAPFADNKIWVEDHYTTVKVLDSGVLRTCFEVSYNQVAFGDLTLSKKLLVTLDAGSQFNKAEVSYDGDFESIKLAAGIFLHSEPGDITIAPDLNYISYAENVISEAGVPAGRSYIALIFPNRASETFQDEEHIAGILNYKKGETSTYYFGSGWNQWGFENDDSWIREINSTIEKLKNPVRIVEN